MKRGSKVSIEYEWKNCTCRTMEKIICKDYYNPSIRKSMTYKKSFIQDYTKKKYALLVDFEMTMYTKKTTFCSKIIKFFLQ